MKDLRLNKKDTMFYCE